MALAATTARRPVPRHLARADGLCAVSGNLGQRQDQGLSAMVLGRAAGAAGQAALPERSQRLFRVHLSAAAGDPAGLAERVWKDRALSRPLAAQRRRMV